MDVVQKIIVANWKMHMTIGQALDFMAQLKPLISSATNKVAIAAPFTALWHVAESAKGTGIEVGVQNVNAHEEGAYTGEISVAMAKEAGARFAIVGHSERRKYFNESNHCVNEKVKSSLRGGLKVLLCIGESLADRQAGSILPVLQQQLEESLRSIAPEQLPMIMLAYEPIWAIGTGQVATIDIIQGVHQFCRKTLMTLWGESAAAVPVLYGGSVNPENTPALLAEQTVDGLLVGGASLKAHSMSAIVNHQILSRSSS